MSRARKNNETKDALSALKTRKENWTPSASHALLRERAALYQYIRQFFADRDVLEVDTPLLASTTVTDPSIESLSLLINKRSFYLQTSPEYAMKRLLAAGSGSIYQICKAFRSDEIGRLHHPEFTMLEWYRLGFDHHQLMDEIQTLLQAVLNVTQVKKISYETIFRDYLSINPLEASLSTLKKCCLLQDIRFKPEDEVEGDATMDRDAYLQLLFSYVIEPRLAANTLYFIYDYPVQQAALARLVKRQDGVMTASRFEVYFNGIELANGFHELSDSIEQRARFEINLAKRKSIGSPPIPIDECLLAALAHGLPDCAGVALGLDRLLMLKCGRNDIADVLTFSFDRV